MIILNVNAYVIKIFLFGLVIKVKLITEINKTRTEKNVSNIFSIKGCIFLTTPLSILRIHNTFHHLSFL